MINKGDLVLVSDENGTSTCVILSEPFLLSSGECYSFHYAYCLENGVYGLIYDNEIVSVVCEKFAPDFKIDSDFFNMDMSFYDYFYEMFSYFPCVHEDDDSEE